MPTTVQFIIRVIILPFYQLLYISTFYIYFNIGTYSRQGFNPGLTARTGEPRQARIIYHRIMLTVCYMYLVYTYTT